LHGARLHRLYSGGGNLAAVFPAKRLSSRTRGLVFAAWPFGGPVDFIFLAVLAVFLLITLALVAGCAALERKK
jgi:hypothetical protein